MQNPQRYHTAMAAEFHVLSMLHRRQQNAVLTLGNNKGIDIVIDAGPGRTRTVDVKGIAGGTGWPADNIGAGARGHYFVFVAFLGHMAEPDRVPEVWVVPSVMVRRFIYKAPGGARRVVSRAKLRQHGKRYLGNWELLSIKQPE